MLTSLILTLHFFQFTYNGHSLLVKRKKLWLKSTPIYDPTASKNFEPLILFSDPLDPPVQSFNLLISRSINHSTHRSISSSINQPFNQSTNKSVDLSISQSVNSQKCITNFHSPTK